MPQEISCGFFIGGVSVIVSSMAGILLAVGLIVLLANSIEKGDAADRLAWRYLSKICIGLNALSIILFSIHLGMALAIGVIR